MSKTTGPLYPSDFLESLQRNFPQFEGVSVKRKLVSFEGNINTYLEKHGLVQQGNFKLCFCRSHEALLRTFFFFSDAGVCYSQLVGGARGLRDVPGPSGKTFVEAYMMFSMRSECVFALFILRSQRIS